MRIKDEAEIFHFVLCHHVGILAKKAVEAGLSVKPFIKTSLSPGSGVVTYYLKESGVLEFVERLGWVIHNQKLNHHNFGREFCILLFFVLFFVLTTFKVTAVECGD